MLLLNSNYYIVNLLSDSMNKQRYSVRVNYKAVGFFNSLEEANVFAKDCKGGRVWFEFSLNQFEAVDATVIEVTA